MLNSKKIIVSLDGMSKAKALQIASKLSKYVWGFKVNDLIYEDLAIIKQLKQFGHVFADVKFYDIPSTVANCVKRLSSLHVDMITVHASGGIEMMRAAKINSGRSKIIAVTVLTSKKLESKTEVLHLVRNAIKAKVSGIVCSGHELGSIKKLSKHNKLIMVVPGIRPKAYKVKDDQKRKMTPNEALNAGADYLVIGRPITQSKNILKALEDIKRE